jgi:geranylgeranyl diphosphate synthase, type II
MNSLRDLKEQVKSAFDAERFISDPPELYEPIDYTLSLGGKRIRPLMVLAGCELFGGDPRMAIKPAIGIEIFHNFTLLHDDIMDQAPLRRGKETVYKKWSTNTAILSGDTMFAMASEYISKTDPAILPVVLELFNRTAREVCEGQQFDMNYESRENVSLTEYLNMIRLKTAVLLAASLKMGAVIAGAGRAEAGKIYAMGENLGLAFQLRDDLLDVFGDEKKFGKEIGRDIVSNKKTWLFLKAHEISDENQRRELNSAFYDREIEPAGKIRKVKGIYENLNIRDSCYWEISVYSSRALNYLDEINVPDDRKSVLRELSNELLNRDF